MDTWEESATLIAHDLFEWSQNCLEPSSERHGGMPACPFAGAEWLSGRTVVHITDTLQTVISLKARFPPSADQSHVIALTNLDGLSPKGLQYWVENQNRKHFGIWLKAFHPADAPNPRVPAHERPPEWPAVDDYAVIVMQSLERIVSASNQLMGTPYYQSFSPQSMQHVDQRCTMLETWHSLTDGPSYNAHDERAIKAAEQGIYQ